MKKKRKPVAAILQFLVGLSLVVITVVLVALGKVQDETDIILAALIALAGLLEGTIGYIEWKKKI